MKKLIFLVIIALFLPVVKEKKIEKPIRIILICDVHYGITWSENSVSRVTKAVALINEIMPDVVLIAGDNVHYPCHEGLIKEFLSHIKNIKVPVLFTPGNHDIEPPVTLEGLDCYRSFYGEDFNKMECKNYTLIAANSVLWDNSGAPQEVIDLLIKNEGKNHFNLVENNNFLQILRRTLYLVTCFCGWNTFF